jgi:hypothetical protein
VTGVFDVGGYTWTTELGRSGDTAAPHVSAAGPLLSTLDRGEPPAERQFSHLKDKRGAREVRYLAAHGAKAIKVCASTRTSRHHRRGRRRAPRSCR